MSRTDKSAKARAALDQLFSDVPTAGGSDGARPGDPFAPASTDAGVRSGLDVTVSTRIQLRGYPNADAFMKRMAEAWGLTWGAYDNVQAVATLPAGWRVRRLPGVTQIVDARDVLRAESSLQGGDMSYLKVQPRYYIDARRGFGWGKSSRASDDPDLDGPDWRCLVIDRETSTEVHEMTSSPSRADLDNARAALLKWLDAHYPRHRDPFAYWTDCERGV
ncbi:nitroreductase [Burkholderia multivorans]|uniref:nitroreductase n=1 Tax=Burkholderia multivorans TaxID=87883 RepID=UPI000CFE96FC|nr:nitroreductase [Burkholderia multivorans]MCL4663751.1 nitroreductase [Burkholderia multivorans]MCO1357255.1 nitroreductase [Burkholderia multivorans]MCO1414535.1 nitroreductase [Burkholderia multivorans]MCO1448477.1 nitroreductase [Burkholderia multivorans]PRE30999.1 nitroreductase [Burkholderia multivorans]